MFLLYHDEDALQASLVAALRRAGFDCTTVNEAGMRGRSDEEQLEFASSRGRVIYTRNTADFRRLDAEWRMAGRNHSGIIVLTDQRASIGLQLRALESMGRKFTAEEMRDRLEFLLNYA